MIKWLCLCLVCWSAQGADISGRIKLGGMLADGGAQSLSQALGHQRRGEVDAQLRLQWSHSIDSWSVNAAWQLDGRQGSAVALQRDKQSAYPALAGGVDSNLWDLQQSWSEARYHDIGYRWDRLNVSYTGNALVMRVGRQALTWGAGQVFHPLDLVNPFQPVQLDTTYKHGTDMVYGQWLFASGADVQVAVVPHHRTDGMDRNGSKPTQAALISLPGDTLQWTILVANDRSDTLLGLATSGSLGENIWNLEWLHSGLNEGGKVNSLLFNLTRAGVIWQRNYSAFVEFYYNGFGQASDHYSLEQLDPALLTRLTRGQQFVTGRDYLAFGARWDWTPLLQLIPSVITNLNDGSSLVDGQLSWSLSENMTFKADVRWPLGGHGSEFGGLALEYGQAPYYAQAKQVQVQLTGYF